MKHQIPSLKYLFAYTLIATIFCTCKFNAQNSVATPKIKNPKTYFLFLSDVHLNSLSEGVDREGNTGTQLWGNCKLKLDSILNTPNPPAFVLFAGDMPSHYKTSCYSCVLADTLRYQHDTNIRTVMDDVKALVTKNKIPLFYAPGNNDPINGDYFSFSDGAGQTPFSLEAESMNSYPALNVSKTDTGGAFMISGEHIIHGYYSVKVMKGLRVISLNSVIFGQIYYPADGIPHMNAGDTEMNWLESQLKDAADKNDKVYLTMHIPPGLDAYKCNLKPVPADTAMWTITPSKHTWHKHFIALIARYKTAVAGLFYGHTHMDELRLLYDSAGLCIQVAISCPGISVDHQNNPGFKLVSFNPHNKLPIDFTTYYTSKYAMVWGDKKYTFSNIFHTKPGSSIFSSVKGMSSTELTTYVNAIFTVMNCIPSYSVTPGLSVQWHQ